MKILQKFSCVPLGEKAHLAMGLEQHEREEMTKCSVWGGLWV